MDTKCLIFKIFHRSVTKPEHLAICLNLHQPFAFYSYLAEYYNTLFLFGRIVKSAIRYSPSKKTSNALKHPTTVLHSASNVMVLKSS